MDTLDLSAIGLSECTRLDQVKANGGGPVADWLRDTVFDWLLEHTVEAIIDGFKDGTYADWYSSMYDGNPIYSPLR